MRANAGLVIVGRRVTLVPYERAHVAKYHAWMADPWLQEMTASEPLTLAEEFEMQRSWRADEKKCTFIVLARGADDATASFTDAAAIDRMVGDVNLFFNDYDDAQSCEVEIMVAEPKFRRQGFAREAVELMMAYATSRLGVRRFYCKINEANDASLQLFDSLGYRKCNYVAAFQEIEVELLPLEHEKRVVDDVLALAAFHSFSQEAEES